MVPKSNVVPTSLLRYRWIGDSLKRACALTLVLALLVAACTYLAHRTLIRNQPHLHDYR